MRYSSRSPIQLKRRQPRKSRLLVSLLSQLSSLLSFATPVFAGADLLQTAASEQLSERGAGSEQQDWDAKFQSTYVWQMHPAFPARYSGPNSLHDEAEPRSYTLTATAFLGVRPWHGGELYLNPEMIMSHSLSNLTGLGGFTNGENQKGGGPTPTFYDARLFLRETWGLGGGTERSESAPNQLTSVVDRNRVVLTIGRISVIDIFDNNAFAHDPRTQFLNWALMTYGAFDFAADQSGYTWGAALEDYLNDWVFRIGRFEQPKESNGKRLDDRLLTHYGDQIEVEHDHEIAGQPGKLRVLVFHNRAYMGTFQGALDYWNDNRRVGVPSVANVRKDQSKYGLGANLEQDMGEDVGLFIRASWNDGGEETYAFTEIERSLSGGVVVKGTAWGRREDSIGLAFARNGLSSVHQRYLAAGGLGFFIGDGALTYRPEQIFEGYYNLAAIKHAVLSLDYQYVVNPAYNVDRGPVSVYGARMHVEF